MLRIIFIIVTVAVRSFLPPRASISRNIGNSLNYSYYNRDILLKMFRSEATAGVICLPRMPLTAPELQNTDTNGIHADSANMRTYVTSAHGHEKDV